MKQTANLTDPFTFDMSDKIAGSHEGMAHWKGTGPAETMCHQCSQFDCKGEKVKIVAGAKRFTRGRCMKFVRMTGVKRKHFPGNALSYKFFNEIGGQR